MQVIDLGNGVYTVTMTAEEQAIIDSVKTYHAVNNEKIVKRLLRKGIKRYQPKTIADIDGVPNGN